MGKPSEPDALAPNPFAAFAGQAAVILDGGLATELEARGCDLDDELWSARVLLDSPGLIRDVHRDFLASGADCITTASYQASLEGFRGRGFTDARGIELLQDAVRLAVDARDAFWREEANRRARLRPLVAASVGPYGAFLADGSEYTGDYGVGEAELHAFHGARWQILAAGQADLLACETIPSAPETGVLLQLLRETPYRWAWVSFSCADGSHICDGTPLVEVARLCDAEDRVAAVGINCTPPTFVSSLIEKARRGTEKPILVYPNSGEQYEVAGRTWVGDRDRIDWRAAVREWVDLGAAGVGGCCRVRPGDIAEIRGGLLG